jgi:hypothetical protein
MQTSDKDLVIHTIQGMFTSADKRDWNTCKSYFTENPFIDYSSLSAIPGSEVMNNSNAQQQFYKSWLTN